MKKLPLQVAGSRARIAQAASATISGLRQLFGSAPGIIASAAVAMAVRGQRALTAIPRLLNSRAMPRTQRLIPYLEMV